VARSPVLPRRYTRSLLIGFPPRRLKLRAAEHGRSAESEHREILRAALITGPTGKSLKDALMSMPDVGGDDDFARPVDTGREVEL
jgi:plasmid stability protein